MSRVYSDALMSLSSFFFWNPMTSCTPRLIAIVPAAGTGSRAAGGTQASSEDAGLAIAKQYRLLKGRPMLRWAVSALLADPRICQVRVAVAPGDNHVEQALAGLPRTVWRPCGGPSRAHTVMAALHDSNADPEDWVLVHDAARPGLPAAALARLIDQCLEANNGGLLALPVADTVKRSGRLDGVAVAVPPQVIATVPRTDLWLAQTPQMFPAGQLLQALQVTTMEGGHITDEASALEQQGYQPILIPGSMCNFKVTWPEDFGLMEQWLEAV